MRFQGRVCQAKTAQQMCPSQSRPRAARTHTHARMRARTHTHTHRSHLLQTYLCACRSGLLGPDASCDMTCVECLHCSVFQSRGLPLPSIDNTRRECVSTCVNQTCFHFHCNHLGVSSPGLKRCPASPAVNSSICFHAFIAMGSTDPTPRLLAIYCPLRLGCNHKLCKVP